MSKKKNKYSVCKVVRVNHQGREIVVGYLSNRAIEQGLDIQLDLAGYTILAI